MEMPVQPISSPLLALGGDQGGWGRLPGNVRSPSPELTVNDAGGAVRVCAWGGAAASCPVVAQWGGEFQPRLVMVLSQGLGSSRGLP